MLCCFRIKEVNAKQLNEEYQRLVRGLKEAKVARETDVILANPGGFYILKLLMFIDRSFKCLLFCCSAAGRNIAR